MKSVRERDFHQRLQKHGFALKVPVSYVNIPVATDDGPKIVPWPVLDPHDFALLLQVDEPKERFKACLQLLLVLYQNCCSGFGII